MNRIAVALAVILAAAAAHAQDAPPTDHHQHLFSPALASLISPAPPAAPIVPIGGDEMIALLDAAGIKRAVVLSTAAFRTLPLTEAELLTIATNVPPYLR